MTIKELCQNTPKCCNCPFQDACDALSCNVPWSNDDDVDILITKSIIKTAQKLQEDKYI